MIAIRNVEILSPTRTAFDSEYRFRITFECISPLEDDVEWKLVFLSSPGHPDLDQELDSFLVGPIPVGINSFEFVTPAPNPQLIPAEDLLGVAAIILSGSYRDAEFVRVGYYQNTEYDDEELRANPPEQIQFHRLVRELAANKPRVTRFNIRWDQSTQQEPNGPTAYANGPGAAGTGAGMPGSALPRDYSSNGAAGGADVEMRSSMFG